MVNELFSFPPWPIILFHLFLAAWKVVKSWLPGKSAELVKFVSRSDLKEFVPPGEQLVEWGGTVQYHFVFEPEFLPAAGPVTLNGQIEDSKKKVHFAEDTASNDLGGNDQTDVVKKPVPGMPIISLGISFDMFNHCSFLNRPTAAAGTC